jgi:diguanylate cyclase (GGDEF)-like protein
MKEASGQVLARTAEPSIVIVDDMPDNLRLLTGILNEQGYKVRPAPSGTRALATIHKEPPALILLDIMMPDMDGYDVCRQLKADEKTSNIPIIFLSALNEVFDKVKAFKAGGVDFITKPFQVEEVLARVRTHLTIRAQQEALAKKNKELEKKNALITEQAIKLEQLATKDYLTGLSNRRDFQTKAYREVKRYHRNRKPFAIIMIDIDLFKQVNDTHGHDFGDKVLVAIGRGLENMLRAQDIVARWGGEEFIALLPETKAVGAKRVAEKIRMGISACRHHIGNISISVTATLGIAVFDDGLGSIEDCIKRADTALYVGKEGGRNQVVLVSDHASGAV